VNPFGVSQILTRFHYRKVVEPFKVMLYSTPIHTLSLGSVSVYVKLDPIFELGLNVLEFVKTRN
jgi:hypothetical protein